MSVMKLTFEEIKTKLFTGENINLECKEAEFIVPKSVYESYSAFANTNGGDIILGIKENKKETNIKKRFVIQGISNPSKQIEDFWNTVNGNKVNTNILSDDDVYIVSDEDVSLIVIHVPRASYNLKPIFIGENPYKGTFKRNNEGDYHATEHEVRAMIRDQNPNGNDGSIIEHYTMDDIDMPTFKAYRQMFKVTNPEHVWNGYEDIEFLKMLGGYSIDRTTGVEGLTLAGLLIFGKGLSIREKFDNIFMDYRDETCLSGDMRWSDRVTYDGTWENNLFNFFTIVTRKLIADLKKPFKLENETRIDDTPVHKAVREGFVNLIIHSDYMMDAGVLKIIKNENGFEFTNPGVLKLPKDEIYLGGNSKARNPKMQTMLRMVGFGDNAGSGFPAILETWKNNGWVTPELVENTVLNQVTLSLTFEKVSIKSVDKKVSIKSVDKKVSIKTEHNRELITEYIRNHGSATSFELSEYLNLSRTGIKKIVTRMNNIEPIGTNKDRKYILKEK